ncbi:MAG: PepSY domain-containing protein [Cardiobacteriaceae bacterium]|nr:PepSY domain-containing protein [Cardiobacteriaceae bacterium]
MKKILIASLFALGFTTSVFAEEPAADGVKGGEHHHHAHGDLPPGHPPVDKDGKPRPPRQLNPERAGKIALEKFEGGKITDIDFEYHENLYEVEVLDKNGKKFEVKINAKDGTVVSTREDD